MHDYVTTQRMRFIDRMLEHYGYVQRPVIADFFGVGLATATRDLNAYRTAHPNNTVYDANNKQYIRTRTFVAAYA